MAGISYGDYDQAYRQVRGGKGIVPDSALAAAPLAAAPRAPAAEPDEIGRARETSDVMWRLSHYKTIDCDCGTRLRVPPGFRDPSITCPHCGREHRV
jgi:heat shock protein HtpX